ncbi:MAG: hypothetical protein MUC63_11010, partial [Planctomycetes bacterium]|nr:hypothetical protein [Planctomycetota bacterium]
MGNGDRAGAPALETLHPLELKELLAFGRDPGAPLSDEDLARAAGITEAQHRRAVELLSSRGWVERDREEVEERIRFEGEDLLAGGGLYEFRIVRELESRETALIAELRTHEGWDAQEVGKAVGFLKKVEAVSIAEGGALRLAPAMAPRIAALQDLAARSVPGGLALRDVPAADRPLVDLKIRRRGKERGTFGVSTTTRRWYRLAAAGREALAEARRRGLTGEEAAALTPQMLKDGSWKGKAFRRYNLDLAP